MYFYPLGARRIFHTEITPSDWFKEPVFVELARSGPFFGKVLSEEILLKLTRTSQHKDFRWSTIEKIVDEYGAWVDFDFTGTTFSHARFKNCTFVGCKFWNTDLRNTDFLDCTFKNCSFGACHTEGSLFHGSSFLEGTIFHGDINPNVLDTMKTFIGPCWE